MGPKLDMANYSLWRKLADAGLFLLPVCLVAYVVVFHTEPEPGRLGAVLAHWCLSLAILAVAAMVVYDVLHFVRYQISGDGVVRIERRLALFKTVERVGIEAIAEVAVQTTKSSFTGTPRYLVVLRLKDGRAWLLTSSGNQQRAHELQALVCRTTKLKGL